MPRKKLESSPQNESPEAQEDKTPAPSKSSVKAKGAPKKVAKLPESIETEAPLPAAKSPKKSATKTEAAKASSDPTKAPPEKAKPAPKKSAAAKKSGLPALAANVPFDPEGHVQISFRPFLGGSVPATSGEPSQVVELPEISNGELPVMVWRTKTGRTGESPEASQTLDTEPSGEQKQARGRTRTRSRKPLPEHLETSDEAALEEEQQAPAAKPPVVQLPKKLPIAIPEDAPQVVVRNGVPELVRNHRIYPPIIFFGNPADERRAETVFEELRMAAEEGVHLHSFLVELPVDLSSVDQSARVAAYLLTKAIEVDSEAQILFRIEFQSPRGWELAFPDSIYKTAHGEAAEPSVCDNAYWKVAEDCLRLFVKKLLLLDSASHIFGLHLERGEWFLSADHGFDNSRAAVKQFQNWARRRYLDDEVTLRASWFDGSVSFDSISVPPFTPEGLDGDHFIRSSRKQRRYVDYHLFLSDETVHRISELAYAAKEASEGMLLVGVSYGYTFEWSHPSSGHLALGKLLRTDEIDFIAGPPSYRNRGTGGSAAFPCPIDSFALNGKLFVSEEDFKTSLSRGHEPDDFNPPLRTPQALESVHWRGAGAALAHASGVEWMDLWGNGWLKTHSVWERAKRIRAALVNRMEAPLTDPDVAVFIDERSLAYLVDSHAFELLVQSVRESVLRAGVSAAFYLLSDLQHREKFPESRLYLFLNAWDVRPELRAAIKSRLQRDNKVLFWLYAAGLFDAGRESLERAREVTGIALKPQPFHSRAGTTILNRRHPLAEAFPERNVVGEARMEPSYFAIPEDGIVLGEYTQTGLPSFVVKEFNEDPTATWTSVFLGEPVVNAALIRALAQMAGAHVWNFHEDVVHVRGSFCSIHCSGTGPRTITLPSRSCAFNLLTSDWAAVDATNLKFFGMDGSTHVFLVGQRAEIEHFLQTDPDVALTMENIPVRESNVRHDTSNFDVPIMKLNEWMEGGDQDEVADEWFLRPQALMEEGDSISGQAEESPEQVGKRRRKRRRGRGADEPGYRSFTPSGHVDVATVKIDEDESFSMNVVFRKRD